MSDYTDYDENLAFAPTSADDLGERGRLTDVLIKAIEKCEKLEKENQHLKELLIESKFGLDAFIVTIDILNQDTKGIEKKELDNIVSEIKELIDEMGKAIGEMK